MREVEINFYGLLHIDRQRNLDANLKWTTDPVDVYVCCAALAAKSARANGIGFGLFTNEPDFVRSRLGQLGLEHFDIVALQSPRDVPRVKKFYSAHFKIDVIKALGTGQFGHCVGLVDVDTVFCRPMPPSLADIAQAGLAVYDVSRGKHPLHWDRRIRPDLELIAGAQFEDPGWFGGEFLVGTDAALRVLAEAVEACWPRYVANVASLHHVGDEMTVSAALNNLKQRGFPVTDISEQGLVVRWWSWRTKYPQPALAEIKDHMLLHLPADKKFLAQQARHEFSPASFLEAYTAHIRRKIAPKRVFSLIDPWNAPRIEAPAARRKA